MVANNLKICEFFIEIVQTTLLMHVIFGYCITERIKVKLLVLFASIVLIITVLSLVEVPHVLISFINILFMMIITLVIFSGRKRKILLLYFICYLFIMLFDAILYLLVIKLLDTSPVEFLYDSNFAIRIKISSLVIITIITIILKKNGNTFANQLKNLHWSNYLIIIWLYIGFTFQLGYILFTEGNNRKIPNLKFITLVQVAIAIMTIIILMCRASYARDKYKGLVTLSQEYLEMQQQYYLSLSEKNEDIRRFRHDINNHFICLSTIAKEGRCDKMIEYLDTIIQNSKEITYRISTGNYVADAIINDTLQKHTDINISITGSLPAPLHINAPDLCTIISNALNNAVEAVERLADNKRKTIRIEIRNLDNNIYIKMVNSVKNKVTIKNNTIDTTKSERRLHGFGLGNMQMSIIKYYGNMELSCTDNEFTLEIVLKNKMINRS